MEGQKERTVSYSQAPRTAGSSRNSWQPERKQQLIKLSHVLIRQALGSDSRAGDAAAGGLEGRARQRQNKVSQGSG